MDKWIRGREVVKGIIRYRNPYVAAFQTMGERMNEQKPARLVLMGDQVGKTGEERRYTRPTAAEVAMIIPGNDDQIAERLLTAYQRKDTGQVDVEHNYRLIQIFAPTDQSETETRQISETHMAWEPLRFPLMFFHGDRGWAPDLQLAKKINPKNKDDSLELHLTHWAKYYVQTRNCRPDIKGRRVDFNSFGPLFCEYLVDTWARIESMRLKQAASAKIQKQMKADLYSNVEQRVAGGWNAQPETGKKVILPSSFTGGPRDLRKRYYDAMAMMHHVGNDHTTLFVTATCKPTWPEIQDELRDGEEARDRPDLVNRVFQMKLKALLRDLGVVDGSTTSNHFIFDKAGKCIGYVHRIEFQKRGLPHAHIIVVYFNKLTLEMVDAIVCAELPDPQRQPKLFAIVAQNLIHKCSDARCLDKETKRCTKNFPKPFVQETTLDENGRVHYRRRDQTHVVNGKSYNNAQVVPYNPMLTLKYGCHINVEIMGSNGTVKYLFKYITKSGDRAIAVVQDEQSDEIKWYLDGRYICSQEAHWRISQFKIAHQNPSCLVLDLHLEGQNHIRYRDDATEEEMAEKLTAHSRTHLTEFFESNKVFLGNDDYAPRTYVEFGSAFVWHTKDRKWKKRKNQRAFETFARLSWISPRQEEVYYLRLLLLHVVGPIGFADLRTYEGTVYSTYMEAAVARGLAGIDDRQWVTTLEEAVFMNSNVKALRDLLVMILVNNEVFKVTELWDEFADRLSEDFSHQIRQKTAALDENARPSEDDILHDARSMGLRYIREQLQVQKADMLQRLPLPDNPRIQGLFLNALNRIDFNRLQVRETSLFDADGLQALFYVESYRMLNAEQKAIVDYVIEQDQKGEAAQIVIDAPGGCGKTTVLKTILAYFRSKEGQTYLACATTGIAAELIPLGDTAHRKFGIPIDLDDDTLCRAATQTRSDLHETVSQTKGYALDEGFSANRLLIDCINRSCAEIKSEEQNFLRDTPHGNLHCIISGDPRQTGPVVPGADRATVVASSFVKSVTYQSLKPFKLTQNMRLSNPNLTPEQRQQVKEFAEFLLKIGEGTYPAVEPESNDVYVPDELVWTGSVMRFFKSIYGDLERNANNMAPPDYANYLAERAILAPLNTTVREVNKLVTKYCLPGETTAIISEDGVQTAEGGAAAEFPGEILNRISIQSLPEHRLDIKKKMVLMVMRNLSDVLKNGTRVVINNFTNRCLFCTVISGPNKGTDVFIPRIKFIDDKCQSGLNCVMYRIQFPVQVCWCMTVNKAQGQSLRFAYIYLETQCFAHGQLYVGISRATTPQSVKILSMKKHDDRPVMTNIVWPELLQKNY
jgi:hypothetical protein